VPIVRYRDLDDIGLLLLEQFGEVAVARGRLAGLVALGGRLLIRRQALAVGVSERDDLDVIHLHQAEEVALPYQPEPTRATRRLGSAALAPIRGGWPRWRGRSCDGCGDCLTSAISCREPLAQQGSLILRINASESRVEGSALYAEATTEASAALRDGATFLVTVINGSSQHRCHRHYPDSP